MVWDLTGDVEKFAEAAGDFLRSRPVQHTVPLTLIAGLRQRGPHAYGPEDPLFGTWRTPSGVVAGVLLQTPPYPMLFTAVPAEAVPAAVDELAGRPLAGVNLLTAAAETFVARWQARTGARATVRMRTRLYRLDALTPPPAPPGIPRVAGPADRDLVIGWLTEFQAQIGERPRDVEQLADEWLATGRLTLWTVDGAPVSMAARSAVESGMARVQAVYTPAALRRHGYAGAATVVASRAALDAGAKEVVLYTDLANPTSNALYQRLGYRPVEDRTVVDFT